MAKAELLKALIHSHFEEDLERFNLLALQIAAQEARLGHNVVAMDIKDIIDRSRTKKKKNILLLPGFDDLIEQKTQRHNLTELVSPPQLKNQLGKIILEYRHRDILERHGLSFRRKILMSGPPGTGKTMSASVIATELQLPLYVVLIDRIVQKYMGETNAKLRQVFDIIREHPGIYFFDEFDAIGGERSKDNDVGEMRRVVNAFLQFLENDHSKSFILAATNNIKLLDQALFRRFDDIIVYKMPSEEEARKLIYNTLGTFSQGQKLNDNIKFENLSQAQIVQIARDTIKDAILSGEKKFSIDALVSHLQNKLALQRQLNL